MSTRPEILAPLPLGHAVLVVEETVDGANKQVIGVFEGYMESSLIILDTPETGRAWPSMTRCHVRVVDPKALAKWMSEQEDPGLLPFLKVLW